LGYRLGGCLPAWHFFWSFAMRAGRQLEKGEMDYD
jgi:hypothetical protein